MYHFVLMLSPLLVGIGFYLYFFIKGFLEFVGLDTTKKAVKLSTIIASVILTLICFNISGFGTILILHIVLSAMVIQLLNFIIKLIFKKKYSESFSFWKKLYKSRIIPIALSVFTLVFGYINLHNVVATNYTVLTDKNIRAEGYRVALLADVHYGVSIDDDVLKEKCDEISSKKPDIVILCGDIVDNLTTKEQMLSVFKHFGSIESHYGIYYVHGNHDRPMSVISSSFTEQELTDAIQNNGITILRDDVVQITDDLVLIGREDRSIARGDKSRMSIKDLISQVDTSDFVLTLDHQPNEYAENAEAGTDLILSGHTHGGQIFPLDILQEIIPFNDAVYGQYQLDSDSQAIVTSGVAGWAYPIKTASPSEYVIIDIKSK